jgi:hypothetical protein
LQLDTLQPDGAFSQLAIQAAPVEGKADMKRLRVEGGLAAGSYAFAVLEGYFNDGKHRLWPFKIVKGARDDNSALVTASSLELKPKTARPLTPATTGFAPPGAAPPTSQPTIGSVARATTSRVILRSGPTQLSPKLRNLAYGEAVTILGYSSNVETFRGRVAPFARVQTVTGEGWVFAAYLR